jgi:hypothetical protein
VIVAELGGESLPAPTASERVTLTLEAVKEFNAGAPSSRPPRDIEPEDTGSGPIIKPIPSSAPPPAKSVAPPAASPSSAPKAATPTLASGAKPTENTWALLGLMLLAFFGCVAYVALVLRK